MVEDKLVLKIVKQLWSWNCIGKRDQEKITWQESDQTYSQDLQGAVVRAASCEAHVDNMLVLSVYHVGVVN